ncbi:MAG: hypothetical protein AAGI24_03860 [Pseudomonadota bacterium]
MKPVITRTAGAALALILATLMACDDSGTDASQALTDWVATKKAELPRNLNDFVWSDVRRYENQIIATYQTGSESGAAQMAQDAAAFAAVTEAVCSVTDMDVVWQASAEHYVSLQNASGEVLHTIQTKAFDCCVLSKRSTMSLQQAQYECPYE